jgi:hypothetical protein
MASAFTKPRNLKIPIIPFDNGDRNATFGPPDKNMKSNALTVMKSRGFQSRFASFPFRRALAILWVASFAPASSQVPGEAVQPPVTTTATAEAAWKIPNDQLDSLVAPIALYPDELLSQTLVASTYPLEVIQLQQWLARNKTLKDKALADAVLKQNWDPSIQAMVAVPDVVERMAGNIQWTTELGNAFLAQPDDVLAAIQRMRVKAQGSNALVTTEQQTVGTEVVEGGQQVITIQQANPQVIYVPSYDPVVVYGAPVYPYPSYIYPGYVVGRGLAFGAGLALGAAWGGGWGYHCGWGGGGVNVNVNNTYVNNFNKVNNINNISGGNKWQHQPAHRGGAPYGPGGIGGVGGGTRPGGIGGIGGVTRPGGIGGIGGVGGVNRPGGVGGIGGIGNKPGGIGGIGNNPGGIGSKPGGIGGIGNNPGGIGSKPGGIGGVGNKPGGAGGISKPGGAGGISKPGGAGGIGSGTANRPTTKPATRPSAGGSIGSGSVSRPAAKPATRPSSSSIGGRSVSSGASSRSAFGGSGASGSAARASSSRGASSMSRSTPSRGGGGASRGGGGGRR